MQYQFPTSTDFYCNPEGKLHHSEYIDNAYCLAVFCSIFCCCSISFCICRETAHVLQQIGDDLNSNTELNALLSNITITRDTAFETFASIASEVFRDGVINWGRIVSLIYLGYRLAVKVLFEGGLLKTIITWIVKFIGERLVDWIVNSGGWVGGAFVINIPWCEMPVADRITFTDSYYILHIYGNNCIGNTRPG